MYLASTEFKYTDAETLLGLGVFCIWAKTLSLFDNAHPYDLMSKTFMVAFPTFMRVLAGILPYSIGTGFLAITLFWQSHDYFKSYASAQWYVFATQTGDGIFAMFSEMIKASNILGYIFGFVYDFLIISCVQSIFMVVIEDAYVTAKYSKTNSWLLDTIGEDLDEETKLDELITETQQAKDSTPKMNEPVEKKSDALLAKMPKRLTVVVEDDMSEAFEDDDLIR